MIAFAQKKKPKAPRSAAGTFESTRVLREDALREMDARAEDDAEGPD